MRNLIQTLIILVMTLILISFLTLGLTGCSPDQVANPQTDADKINLATADDLMMAFVEIYGNRDLDLYGQLLHENFIYTFDPHCCGELGPVYEYFTREDELICAQRMFSGKAGVNSRGQAVPAILDIDFNYWAQEGSWELEHDGQLRGVFRADIVFLLEDSASWRVTGRQVFTVTTGDNFREVGGGLNSYQIIGWQELSGL
jgi:hypothetical protein